MAQIKKSKEINESLPFVLRFGIKPTVSLKDEFDDNGLPTAAYHYKSTQTIAHDTYPRTSGKQPTWDAR